MPIAYSAIILDFGGVVGTVTRLYGEGSHGVGTDDSIESCAANVTELSTSYIVIPYYTYG
jgi:hypothetical protein